MTLIKLNEETLRSELKEQVKLAHDFDWSGWGIDVCVNSSGQIWSSDMNNGQNYYPNSDKIARVLAWTVDDLDDENPDREESIEYYSERIVDSLIEKIEWNDEFEII